MFNPKQAGGGGGQNLPAGRFFPLSEYKPVPWDMHCCHWSTIREVTWGGGAESTPPSCIKFWKAWPVLGKRAQLDLFILKLCTWYDLLVANNTTCKTNDLIQSNRSVFLLLQNYSQAFSTVVSHWWWDKVVLAKSVSKLLLAASTSKARLIAVTWYFMFAFGLLYVRFQEWPKEGPLLESDSNKHQDQNRATIRVGLE